jgi:hypothetical protein
MAPKANVTYLQMQIRCNIFPEEVDGSVLVEDIGAITPVAETSNAGGFASAFATVTLGLTVVMTFSLCRWSQTSAFEAPVAGFGEIIASQICQFQRVFGVGLVELFVCR